MDNSIVLVLNEHEKFCKRNAYHQIRVLPCDRVPSIRYAGNWRKSPCVHLKKKYILVITGIAMIPHGWYVDKDRSGGTC